MTRTPFDPAESGYAVRIPRFSALGFSLPNFVVHAHSLGPGAGVDGLLGLNFLRRLDYGILSHRGLILAAPARAA